MPRALVHTARHGGFPRWLTIKHSSMSGTLPNIVAGWHLELSHNAFSGTIPTTITTDTFADLSYNNFANSDLTFLKSINAAINFYHVG